MSKSANTLVPIGHFAKTTGLTRSTLRFYDEVGLLRPAQVDPETGYRYYRREQTVQAEQIRLLRALEVPLNDIQCVFDAESPATLHDLIARQRRSVEERIAKYREALVTLDALQTCEIFPYQVKAKEVSAQPYIYLREETSLAKIGGARKRAFEKIEEVLRERGLGLAVPPFLLPLGGDCERHLDWSDASPWRFTVDFCVPTEDLLEPPAPFAAALLPAATLAYTLHIGPYEPLHLASRTVRAWALEAGRGLGQKREVYFVGHGETNDTSRFRTEVQYVLQGGSHG